MTVQHHSNEAPRRESQRRRSGLPKGTPDLGHVQTRVWCPLVVVSFVMSGRIKRLLLRCCVIYQQVARKEALVRAGVIVFVNMTD